MGPIKKIIEVDIQSGDGDENILPPSDGQKFLADLATNFKNGEIIPLTFTILHDRSDQLCWVELLSDEEDGDRLGFRADEEILAAISHACQEMIAEIKRRKEEQAKEKD